MKTVNIYGSKYVRNLGGYDPDECSRDCTSTSWYVEGCTDVDIPYQSNQQVFDSIETDLTGKLYALFVIYSTGDSFGHDEGSDFEAIWVFDDRALAEKAVQTIQAHADKFRSGAGDISADNWTVIIDIGNGKTLSVYAGWNDYFGCLNMVDFVEFDLE